MKTQLWVSITKKQIFQIWIQLDWLIDFNHCGIFYPFALAFSKRKSFIVKSLVSILESFCVPFLACLPFQVLS